MVAINKKNNRKLNINPLLLREVFQVLLQVAFRWSEVLDEDLWPRKTNLQ